jgi:hypothetical protein
MLLVTLWLYCYHRFLTQKTELSLLMRNLAQNHNFVVRLEPSCIKSKHEVHFRVIPRGSHISYIYAKLLWHHVKGGSLPFKEALDNFNFTIK